MGPTSLPRLAWAGGLMTLGLAACGRVVTARPTPTLTPAPAVSTPTATPVVLRLPTATPVYTPTPSPTPAIYRVQPGDTLYGIALRFGVSVAALQEANGITDPNRLQVGQELIIPPPGPAGEGASPRLPTPTPMALLIPTLRCTASALGSLGCIGEVINPQPHPLINVQIQITLRDGEGREIGSGIAGTALDVLPSQGRSPFALVFNAVPAGYARADARAVRAESVQEPGSLYGPVEVLRTEDREEGADRVVRGEVRNADQQPLRRINVVVAFYDAQDRLLGYRQVVFAEAPTAPGAAQAFEVRFPAREVKTFRVLAEGQR